jgi:hypothetical protein
MWVWGSRELEATMRVRIVADARKVSGAEGPRKCRWDSGVASNSGFSTSSDRTTQQLQFFEEVYKKLTSN